MFWPYVVAALQTAAPGVGEDALSLLQSPQPPPIEAVLATLLNDLNAVPNDVVLVLDDYHLVEAREIQDGMAFLLEHLPPQVHLVLAGRADPPLPLARLRGRGELVEIRAADLRFTADEAAEYLNEVMGLDLTAQRCRRPGEADRRVDHRDPAGGALDAGPRRHRRLHRRLRRGRPLHRRLSGRGGPAAPARAASELPAADLDPEPADRRPVRVPSPASAAARPCSRPSIAGTCSWSRSTTGASGTATTTCLPTSSKRGCWTSSPTTFPFCTGGRATGTSRTASGPRRSATRWPVKHFERAAELVELAIPALRQGRQDATLLHWLEALPDEVVRVRPVLSVGLVGALMSAGELEGVEARLRDAESWLDGRPENDQGPDGPAASMVVVDEVAFRRLPGAIAMYRAGLGPAPRRCGRHPDPCPAGARARRRGRPPRAWRGRGPAGPRLLDEWRISMRRSVGTPRAWPASPEPGTLPTWSAGAVTLADLRIAQGRLREAMSLYEEGLQRATEHGVPALRGAADMHVGISQLRYERNDLEAALQHVQLSRDLGVARRLSAERVPLARRDWRGSGRRKGIWAAPSTCSTRRSGCTRVTSPRTSGRSPRMRARLWVACGRLGEALGWARSRAIRGGRPQLPARVRAHHPRPGTPGPVRGRAGQDSLDEATRLLERLRVAADEGKRTGNLLEILVLQSLAHQAGGDLPTALASLQQALTLAEPEGYVRLFVDEGPPMASLLRAAAKQGIRRTYVGRLLAAINETESSSRTGQPGLIEPLSERELDVLRLLGSDLDGPDIARRLIVSLNTVRTHTNHIYAKLGVNNRRAAVRRARELGLLSRTRDH